MKQGLTSYLRTSSKRNQGKSYDSSFTRRLSLTFAGSGFVLLLAGAFALYLMSQLGAAVERAISDILPKTLVAMRLSEHSALLAASAPSLTSASNPRETEQVATGLDRLKTEIDKSVALLEETYESDQLQHVRQKVATLAEALSMLKGATNERIILEERHSAAIARIRQVHSEFSDTVSPVVWGVSSLTRLFGKRVARVNMVVLKELRDRHVEQLIALQQLQLAYRDLTVARTADTRVLDEQPWKVFSDAWQGALAHLDGSGDARDPAAQQLREGGERLRASSYRGRSSLRDWRDPMFAQALEQALANAREAVQQQFASALQTAKSTVADFVEQSVNDMEYALDIKAEGNLLFALLTAVADSDRPEGVSGLQDRFKRSLTTFRNSAHDFLNSQLSQRNPILAANVEDIARRLQALGNGPDNLFDIRRAQLAAHDQIEQLLASNRGVAAQLKQHVERLVGEVQGQATDLGEQLEKSRGVNRILLVMVFLVGLMTLALIAYFAIRTLGKQDREIRQTAMLFESTGEGVVTLDPQARIVAANKAFSDLSGYGRSELTGRNVRMLLSRRHRKAFYEKMLETLAETGRWEGEIYTRNRSGDSQLEWLTVNVVNDNQGKISQYVAVLSDVAIVKRSLQKLDHLAHHDTLTGLPNRLLLRDRVEHAIHRAHRERRGLAVLFLDLDRFKNINDTLGHTVGDNLLRLCAARLSDRMREGDTVARLGGDEFMILLEDYRSPEDARKVAQDVLDSLAQSIQIQGHELFITASIGISQYPQDGSTVDELVRNSDAAMYRAKEKGKNNYHFYTSDLTVVARENLRLESCLRLALERDEFVLHYQPKWDTKTGRITGVEALLRWQHPERGLIGPAEFLGTLEECGLILPVGKWVLHTACAQAQAWRIQGFPPIQMSINLSGQQIVDGSLLQTVTDSFGACGFDPRYLELELTEGFVMQQPDEVVVLLKSLRELGMSIAIDDFGTGYSSLSYLKQLPIQKLKIDRSFVRDIPADPEDVAITSAIIALGHRLQMSIVAEGVETEEQLAFLAHEGCQEAQGFLVSEPVPEQEVRRLLQHGEVPFYRRSVQAGITSGFLN
jgi:diguanylate cyclase (GGDEF)-like protein/PAS domain S-box-containing protein